MSQCRGINHRAFFKHWPPVEETPRLPCRTRGTAIANPCASDARGGDLGKKLWAPEGFPHQGPVPSTRGTGQRPKLSHQVSVCPLSKPSLGKSALRLSVPCPRGRRHLSWNGRKPWGAGGERGCWGKERRSGRKELLLQGQPPAGPGLCHEDLLPIPPPQPPAAILGPSWVPGPGLSTSARRRGGRPQSASRSFPAPCAHEKGLRGSRTRTRTQSPETIAPEHLHGGASQSHPGSHTLALHFRRGADVRWSVRDAQKSPPSLNPQPVRNCPFLCGPEPVSQSLAWTIPPPRPRPGMCRGKWGRESPRSQGRSRERPRVSPALGGRERG